MNVGDEMPRVIVLADFVIVLVVLFLGFHLCLWAYSQYKKEIKK